MLLHLTHTSPNRSIHTSGIKTSTSRWDQHMHLSIHQEQKEDSNLIYQIIEERSTTKRITNMSTIMIAAHVDLRQWRSRERYIKLLLQTHSPEVDYSLLIMVMRLLDLGGVEISPVAAPEESSPPMVADSGWISVFLIYAPPPSRDASGTFIYGVFRSREPSGAFTGWLRCSEEQKT